MFEEKSEEADDEIIIPAEVDVASELEIEEYYGSVPSEDVVAPELTEALENQDYDLKGSVQEAAVTAEIETIGEGPPLLSEVEGKNFEDVPNEMNEVDAELAALNDVEVTQSMSEVDLDNELNDGSLAIFEATVDENTVYVERSDEMSDDVEAATLEAATGKYQMEAIGDPKVPHGGGPAAVDGETSEPQHAVDKSSAPAIEEEANDGFVSAVNEVLARLVEPFEAAK